MDKPKQPQQELKIDLTPEVASGNYSNFAVISHTPGEFFLDFIAVTPNAPQARVQSRIIMNPENAKTLLGALRENIARFEATFGTIEQRKPVNAPKGGNGGIPNPFEA